MSEPQALKLTEKSRLLLGELYRTAQQSQKEFSQAITVAIDMLGLDPSLNHGVDFATGIVTPATVTTPTLVKEEAS